MYIEPNTHTMHADLTKLLVYRNDKGVVYLIDDEYCAEWAGGAKMRWFTRFETAVWFVDVELS
jgi:hypothetical protein